MAQDPRKMTNEALLGALSDERAIAELTARSGGVLPCRDGKPDRAASLGFLAHVADLRTRGMTYRGAEYRGLPLVSVAQIVAKPKATIVCEPFQGHPLESDGTDPETEMVYPVADADTMSRLAWVARDLPGLSATFRPSDLDAQHGVMEALKTGNLTPNLRLLVKRWKSATADERKAAEARLTPEFWSGGGEMQIAPVPPIPAPTSVTQHTPPGPKMVYCIGALRHVETLRQHMHASVKQGLCQIVSDLDIRAGAITSGVRRDWIERAAVFVYLLDSHALAESDAAMVTTMTMRPDARHVPVLTGVCDWRSSPVGSKTCLPQNGKPVSQWADADSAWVDVARGLRTVLT